MNRTGSILWPAIITLTALMLLFASGCQAVQAAPIPTRPEFIEYRELDERKTHKWTWPVPWWHIGKGLTA